MAVVQGLAFCFDQSIAALFRLQIKMYLSGHYCSTRLVSWELSCDVSAPLQSALGCPGLPAQFRLQEQFSPERFSAWLSCWWHSSSSAGATGAVLGTPMPGGIPAVFPLPTRACKQCLFCRASPESACFIPSGLRGQAVLAGWQISLLGLGYLALH